MLQDTSQGRMTHDTRHKVKNAGNLAKTLSALRSKGKRIVFTNGCFDILHVGHVTYLEKAKSLGDVLVVGLNSDKSVRAIKGKSRPINNERDRAKVLAALSFVDYITIFSEATPKELIKKLRPETIVKGGDWKAIDIVGASLVRSYGGRVVVLPFAKDYSTTSLIKRLKE